MSSPADCDPDERVRSGRAALAVGVDVASGIEREPGPQGRRRDAALRGGGAACRLHRTWRDRRHRGVQRLWPLSPSTSMRIPTRSGHFGRYGGRFVAETLIGPLEELAAAYDAARVDPAFHRRVRKRPHALRRPAEPDLRRRRASAAKSAARASCSSARTSTTPARTRSTTPSARRCSPAAWARRGSSPRPAPASTAWPAPPWPRAWAWNAWSTWARSTSSARRSTCTA